MSERTRRFLARHFPLVVTLAIFMPFNYIGHVKLYGSLGYVGATWLAALFAGCGFMVTALVQAQTAMERDGEFRRGEPAGATRETIARAALDADPATLPPAVRAAVEAYRSAKEKPC